MSYVMRREGTNLVVEGTSFGRDKRGNPLLRTQIALQAGGAPISILVRYREREERALRVTSRASQSKVLVPHRDELVEPDAQDVAGPVGPVACAIDHIVSQTVKES